MIQSTSPEISYLTYDRQTFDKSFILFIVLFTFTKYMIETKD